MLFTAAYSRSRSWYALLALLVIAVGLASRKYSYPLPDLLGGYPGDALWALMVFLMNGIARPRWSIFSTAAAALATSFAVELSQVYQAPWLNSIRQTAMGHLVLGSGFDAKDLLAHVVGITIGVSGEIIRLKLGRTSFPSRIGL